jgi:Domain of unknown function (DUF5076)
MENRILEISLLNNKQQFSISSLVWEDPAAWGIVLVDLAKLLAETYSKEHSMDANDAFARIFEGVQAELMSNESED